MKVRSGLQAFLGDKAAPDQYLSVQLLTDNSVYVTISDKQLSDPSTTQGRETPTQVYDRNFTEARKAHLTRKLSEILQVSPSAPFCFNITNPAKPTDVYFSTCQAGGSGALPQVQHVEHNVFKCEYRNSEPKRFFGMGERQGEFFLQNGTTYAFYNNDNNVADQKTSEGKVVSYGKNGFHPIIYS